MSTRNNRSESALPALLGLGGWLAARRIMRQNPAYSMEGKVVLITGGSRGLGLVMARQLAAEGARLVLCARDLDELERARVELVGRGAEALTLQCDVTDPAQVRQTVGLAITHFGHIDVLINNAGVIVTGPLDSMNLGDFEEAMRTHFWGPLYMMMAVQPSMRARREGRIVNISSIGGRIAVPHLVPYCASKHALVGLSNGMRTELLPHNIKVTTVLPGLMRTGAHPNSYFKGRHRGEYAWFSILDTFPLSSISAESAAREIILACKRGDAQVILSPQAQVLARVAGLLPNLMIGFMALFKRFLPTMGGIGSARLRGSSSYSKYSPSILTVLGDRAAVQNNQVPSMPTPVANGGTEQAVPEPDHIRLQ